jgi:molybdate transport system ATP-binding protein
MTESPIKIALQLRREQFNLDVDLTLPAQGISVLFGASGSGKTTLLRCVAGLERAQTAVVTLGGVVWQDSAQGVFVPTWQRQLGYVFQEASLLSHLTVEQNLHYGRRRLGLSAAALADTQVMDAAIELLGIGSLLARRTQALSGGERQRVAIARALALQPQILLLDEPLASLDIARRQEILPWLERLRDQVKTPMLYVTHQPDELARLADTVVVLQNGKVAASGPVEQVMIQANGASNLPLFAGDEVSAILMGTVCVRDTQWHLMKLAFDGGSLWLRDSGLPIGSSVRLRVLARDVSVALQSHQDTSIQNTFACTVAAITQDEHPSHVLLQLRCAGSFLLARITARAAASLKLELGAHVVAQVKTAALI